MLSVLETPITVTAHQVVPHLDPTVPNIWTCWGLDTTSSFGENFHRGYSLLVITPFKIQKCIKKLVDRK